jgi:biopolymer transport protein ExbD
VAPLNRRGVIASIEAHEAAPYRVVAAVQDELRAVDLLRVVFLIARGDAGPSASHDPSLVVLQGLPVVLPDTTMPDPHTIEAGQRNLMRLEVRPDGALLIRRGGSPAEQRVEPRPERVAGIVRRDIATNPNLIALVRTHPDAEYRYMYDVLQGLREADATRFSLQMAE